CDRSAIRRRSPWAPGCAPWRWFRSFPRKPSARNAGGSAGDNRLEAAPSRENRKDMPMGEPFSRFYANRPFRTEFDAVQSIEIPQDQLAEQLIVGFDGLDARSRPFNLLRTQLTKKLDQNGWRMLGVTSATPAAGKTFTSVNLAAALSMMDGRSVLLCDLDLRRGSILKQLGVTVPVTLNEYLFGERDDWTSSLYRINDNRLFILPTQGAMRDSSSVCGSDRFAHLVAQLRALPD